MSKSGILSLPSKGTVNIMNSNAASDYAQKAFITIAKGNSGSYLLLQAPMTGISIQETVDYNIAKALGGNFYIDTFGDQPVRIQLDGIQPYDMSCSKSSTDSVMEFYTKNKLSANNNNRLSVSIQQNGKRTAVFTCVLLALTANAAMNQAESGYHTYSMTLLGVKR